MCKTILTYDCRCKVTTYEACEIYIKAVQRAQRKTGFWRSVFCFSPISISCPAPLGRYAVYTQCPSCQEKILQAELARRQASHRAARKRDEHIRQDQIAKDRMNAQASEPRRIHADDKKRSEAKKELRNRKLAYLCKACEAEGRRPDVHVRKANNYLCCSRGVDEFAAWEGAGYASPRNIAPIQPLFHTPQRSRPADIPAARASGSDTNAHKTAAKPKSTNTIRRDARNAADKYGWGYHRDSTALEPNLVRDFVHSSGADYTALPRPPPRAMPVYEQLHLDKDRWANAYAHTNHGRLPPQPDKPLPYRPLATAKLARKVAPKPLTTTNFRQPESSRRSRSQRGDVSPMTSPLRSAASFVSEINHTLDAEMETWQNLASPVMEPAHGASNGAPDWNNPWERRR